MFRRNIWAHNFLKFHSPKSIIAMFTGMVMVMAVSGWVGAGGDGSGCSWWVLGGDVGGVFGG